MHRLTCRGASVAAATVAVMVLATAGAWAAPIASKMTTAPQGDRAEALASAEAAVDASGVAEQLKGFGLTDEQVKERLAQLSSDELEQLAAGLEPLAVGEQEPTFSTTTWLLIIVILLILAD